MDSPKKTLRIEVTRERFRQSVTMREFVAIQEGNMRVANQVMARFAVDRDGLPVPPDEALEHILDLTIEENDALATQFKTGMEAAAAPKASAPV